jgi:hypothetical protein
MQSEAVSPGEHTLIELISRVSYEYRDADTNPQFCSNAANTRKVAEKSEIEKSRAERFISDRVQGLQK